MNIFLNCDLDELRELDDCSNHVFHVHHSNHTSEKKSQFRKKSQFNSP